MRRVIRGLGIVFLLGGLGVLGWIGWQYFGTGIAANQQMGKAEETLREQWRKPAVAVTPEAGQPLALLRIPKFGADWEKPIVEGVAPDDLARGIGHYPQTQLPGQPGNFAIAGHRVTHGSPFRRLLDLNKGDQVVVETAGAVYTYELDGSPRDLTVKPSDGWVLNPVPGRRTAPTRSIITLTTCQDLFHSPDRSVAFGHLVKVSKK
ncbi:sortase A [Kribbella aluminosa]|uniref:Sortase A n=1 Tax=Kribbella aluminosa TaxID=416017 RepID=A0ABS4UP80_9ACTN|nr:class E sortase [Kribbella aluminosa]MBP2353442.1 sortase A [Kribbella aluminosa]